MIFFGEYILFRIKVFRLFVAKANVFILVSKLFTLEKKFNLATFNLQLLIFLCDF